MIRIPEDWGNKALSRIKKYTESNGIKKPTTGDPYEPFKSTSSEDPGEMKALVYDILRKHVYCTCNSGASEELPESLLERRHLTRLLLRSVLPRDKDDNLQFDMLFSSAPLSSESRFGCWQDVQLLAPR